MKSYIDGNFIVSTLRPPARFRPILLTGFAFVFGVAPQHSIPVSRITDRHATTARILSRVGERRVDRLSTVPTVICPGCLKPMRLTALEPTPSNGLQTATFHCDQCDADTKRVIGRMR